MFPPYSPSPLPPVDMPAVRELHSVNVLKRLSTPMSRVPPLPPPYHVLRQNPPEMSYSETEIPHDNMSYARIPTPPGTNDLNAPNIRARPTDMDNSAKRDNAEQPKSSPLLRYCNRSRFADLFEDLDRRSNGKPNDSFTQE